MKVSKVILCAFSAALLSVSAFAQEDGNRDANGKIVRGPYETNGFWDNWFISVGGGIDYVIDGVASDHQNFGGLTPTLDVNVGKWFTPEFGARLGYQGIAYKDYGEKLGNHTVHGDLLWNISNQFWGYKQTRVYNLVPYMTAGFMVSPDIENYKASLMTGAGLLNNFRINDHWAVNIDVRGIITRSRQLSGTMHAAAGVLSASAGITYNIGKSTWKRAVDNSDALAALEAANKALKDANDALNNDKNALANDNKKLRDENDDLRKRLADAQNTVVEDDGLFILFFDINKSELTKLEKQHLAYFVENLDSDAKLTLTGSADLNTGSRSWNETLAEARVNTVVKALKAAGVSEDRIVVNDSVLADIPAHPEYGRAVIIEY